jgi:hypothetical protein
MQTRLIWHVLKIFTATIDYDGALAELKPPLAAPNNRKYSS